MYEVYRLYCTGLCCPEIKYRYVGYTSLGRESRLSKHVENALTGRCQTCTRREQGTCKKCSWIQKHGAENIRTDLVQAFEDKESAKAGEIHWIAELNTFNGDNPQGLNFTRGGDGSPGHLDSMSPEEYADLRERMSESHKLRWGSASEEDRAQRGREISAGISAVKNTDAWKESRSRTQKIRYSDPEEREKARVRSTEVMQRSEVRAAHRVGVLALGHQKHVTLGVPDSPNCVTCVGSPRDSWSIEEKRRATKWKRHLQTHVRKSKSSALCEFCVPPK